MTGQNLEFWVCGTQRRDLGVPATHIAHTVLRREGSFLPGNVELGVQVVGCFRVVGVLEEDHRQAALLVDRAVSRLRRALLVTEPQPAVGGIDETGAGTGVDGPLRLSSGNGIALLRDARADRNLSIHGTPESRDHARLLLLGHERSLTGVPEHDEALNSTD